MTHSLYLTTTYTDTKKLTPLSDMWQVAKCISYLSALIKILSHFILPHTGLYCIWDMALEVLSANYIKVDSTTHW